MRPPPALLAPLLLLLASVPAPPASATPEETPVQGLLRTDVHWEGTVRLTGDVTVAAGVRLDIAPGTRIVISSKADPRGGWNDALVELHVHGCVVADGDLSAPVRFVPQAWEAQVPRERPVAEAQPWLGIVFHPDASRDCELRGCVFEGGLAAVQAGAPGLVLRDCVFHRCSTGVQTGVLWASTRRPGPAISSSAPRIQRCRFGDCCVGVTVERSGRPEIEHCLFFSCNLGVGNRREGITKSAHGLGPFVDRSLFLACSVGLQGASRLANSMLVGNRTALQASAFQRLYSTVTDRVVRSHNLYHANETIAEGDTPVGTAALLAAPAFVRAFPPAPTVPVLAGSLERAFQLRPSSPAIGAATDGGDLGPTGRVGSLRPWDLPTDPGATLRITRWLVPGPPSADAPPVDDDAARRLARSTPRPGRGAGDRSWAVLSDPPVAGTASPVLAEGPPVRRVALACLDAERGVDAVLVLGLDGRARGWWNGEALPLPETRRRYDPEDLRAPVRLRAGSNSLLLELVPTGGEHRFLCRLVAQDDPRKAPAGVRVDDDAYLEPGGSAGSPLVVETARARRASGDATWTLGLKLSERVHWADVARPGRLLVLETEGGRAVELNDLQVRYKPATRFLRIYKIPLRDETSYRVRLLGARAPDGRSLAVEAARVPVEMR